MQYATQKWIANNLSNLIRWSTLKEARRWHKAWILGVGLCWFFACMKPHLCIIL
jgi:hypothetical protein